MRSGSILTIAFSLLLAAGVAYLGNAWLERRLTETQAPPEQPQVEMQSVVAAAKPLTIGTKIDEAAIKLVEFPLDAVPEGAFTDPKEVLGEIVKQPVYPDELILAPRLLGDSSSTNLLSAIIAPGKRAMAVAVNDVSGVSGFVLPNSRVDVIAAGRDDEAVTFLQNIKTLASGPELQVDGDNIKVGTVTLEVTPSEAEALAKVTADGSVRLTLRNEADENQVLARAPVAKIQDADDNETARDSDTWFVVIRGTKLYKYQDIKIECPNSVCDW